MIVPRITLIQVRNEKIAEKYYVMSLLRITLRRDPRLEEPESMETLSSTAIAITTTTTTTTASNRPCCCCFCRGIIAYVAATAAAVGYS
jgi:hypothetical protein